MVEVGDVKKITDFPEKATIEDTDVMYTVDPNVVASLQDKKILAGTALKQYIIDNIPTARGEGVSPQASYNAVKEYKETGDNNLIDDTVDFLTNNTDENETIIRAYLPAVYDNSSGPANLQIPLWFGTSDQLSVIDDMDTVPANLTAILNGGGGSAGAVAQDTSNQTEGGACATAEFTNADTWAGYSFDFSSDPQSIDDKSLAFAVRAQTLTNFDYVRIQAFDGSANTATYQIVVAEFTADTWYYGANLNPKKATYSDPSFNKNDIQTLTILFHVATSSYTGNLKLDFLCNSGVDEFLAIDGSGNYEPRSLIIHDTGNNNKAIMWLKDYALGLYAVCDFMTDDLTTALDFDFPNSLLPDDVQTIDVFRRGGVAADGSLPITSGEDEVYYCQTAIPESGKINSEIQNIEATTAVSYGVVDIVKGSDQIIINSELDVSADYPNDTEILLTRLQNNRSIDLLGGEPTDALKITGASYDGPTEELTLTVDNTTLLASVPDDSFTEWSLIRLDTFGWVKDKTTGVVSRTIIRGLKTFDEGISYSDNFNRSDGAVGIPWDVFTTGNNSTFLEILSNELYQANISTNTNGTSVFTQDLEMSVFGKIKSKILMRWDSASDGWSYDQGVEFLKNTTNNTNDGLRVTVSDGYLQVTPDLKIWYEGGQIGTVVVTFPRATYYWLEVEYNKGAVKAWFYANGVSKPVSPTLTATAAPTVEIGIKHGIYCLTGATSARDCFSKLDNYFIDVGNILTRFLSKIATIYSEIVKRLTNTTQDPELKESVSVPISS